MKRKLERLIIEAIARRTGTYGEYIIKLRAISPRALRRLGAAARMLTHREAVPVDAAYAAQLAGALAEGCGSCVQIHVTMARKAGVADDQIAAMLQNDQSSLSPDAVLAMRFARAITIRSADEAPAREAVRDRWGDKGVVDLTIATQASRFLSMLKAGFGYATECGPLLIGERTVTPVRHVA
jgi:AhpD family alkylhydroperoxidase